MTPTQPDPEPANQPNGQMPPPHIIKPTVSPDSDSSATPKVTQVPISSDNEDEEPALPETTQPLAAPDADPPEPSTPAPDPLTPDLAPEPDPASIPDQSSPRQPAPQIPMSGSVDGMNPPAAAAPDPATNASAPAVPTTQLFAADPALPAANPAGGAKKKSRAKWLLPLVVGLIVLLGGSAAAYVGYYVPNKPANIWRTALTNSGKGYDALSQYATTNKHAKGVDLNGSFKLSGGLALDGTLSGQSNGGNSEFISNVSALGLKVNTDVRTIASPSNTPDVYFKVDGIQGIGSLFGSDDPALAKTLNGINGQWYVVDHSLFDQFAAGSNSKLQITSADVSSVLKAIGDASKQYVFTSDTTKMVVEDKQDVGKETRNGRSVYHYKVGVNQANLKAYLNALCTNLKASKLKDVLPLSSPLVAGTSGFDCSSWQQSAANTDTSGTADAWVDLHTKLISEIRFSDKNNTGNYLDIGQNYTGGSTYPFTISFQSKSGATVLPPGASFSSTTTIGTFKFSLDTKSNTVSLSGNVQSTGSGAENGSFSLSVKPNNNPVTVTAPAGAKTIIQLLTDLHLNDLLGGTDSTSSPGTNPNPAAQLTSKNFIDAINR